MGNAKNAGKTTVLNSIIVSNYNPLIITSIGLDGEEIDQVTYLEKPQVVVKKGDIVATAKATLNKFKANYKILMNTKIFTSIGEVVICEIQTRGKVLVAGPSLVSDMKKLINTLRHFSNYKILIDGAFFRQSFASVSQASILVIGANYSPDIDKTVEHAGLLYKKLTLPKITEKYQIFNKLKNITILKNDELIGFDIDSLIGNANLIFKDKLIDAQAIYLPKSLTDEFVDELTNNPEKYKFDIVVNSGTNIQLSNQRLKNIFNLKNKIYAINPIEIAYVCYNPYSPSGYSYDKKIFKNKLKNRLNRDVIDVKEVDNNE
ncbi:MAG: hypothetical protein K9L64_02965 [Candidatus Izimaplasma sp.]|nr:hypothetical protein [Candidatus Izimaplasma bacterium]